MVAKYINWRRAAAGVIAVSLLLAPLYLFVLQQGGSDAVTPATLLETPPSGNAVVGVGEGRLAPDFEISAPDGQRLRLSDLRGRPVLINFWATWCGSCLSEMPTIKALQEERGLASFTVLAVNAGERPEQAQEFIDFLQAPFLYGLDVDMRVTDAYGVYGLPLSVFIDSAGVVQAVYRGHADRALLERFVDAATAAKPAGEVPPVLRIVSTIPRERVLSVKVQGSLIVSRSRTLRCDASYCAGPVLEALRRAPGVASVDAAWRDGDTKITVTLSSAAADSRAVVRELASLLEAVPDPVYDGPLRVSFE